MLFYKNIIAAAYKAYSKSKYDDPYFATILLISASQILFIFLFLILLNKTFNINVFNLINKSIIIVFMLLFASINFYVYPKQKIPAFIEDFAKKSEITKKVWGLISIASILFPAILIVLLTSK